MMISNVIMVMIISIMLSNKNQIIIVLIDSFRLHISCNVTLQCMYMSLLSCLVSVDMIEDVACCILIDIM